ncbi:hypothetical protein LIER_25681 [Lithospermum erythrorhizon]|uniref:Uncharacterized protein n=1 Tax=Lithospermum erythrorhizon TaxID=34254 RepID=A0AAV3R5N0_LITER
MLDRYCRLHHPTQITSYSSNSRVFKFLLQARAYPEDNIFWVHGRGKCSFWIDSWHYQGPLTGQTPNLKLKVREVWKNDSCDLSKLATLVSLDEVDALAQQPIHQGRPDLLFWKTTSNGLFSLKDVYSLVRQEGVDSRVFTGL